jgi:hypothetical protein
VLGMLRYNKLLVILPENYVSLRFFKNIPHTTRLLKVRSLESRKTMRVDPNSTMLMVMVLLLQGL